MSETYSSCTTWECPHCGGGNSIEEDEWQTTNDDEEQFIAVGHEQCIHCNRYVYLEFEKTVSLVARSVRKDEFPKIMQVFCLKPEHAEDMAELEGSVDKDDP